MAQLPLPSGAFTACFSERIHPIALHPGSQCARARVCMSLLVVGRTVCLGLARGSHPTRVARACFGLRQLCAGRKDALQTLQGLCWRRSRGHIWVFTQCLLAGSETALHLTAVPYRELPWVWVSVCVCGWLCACVCGAAQSVLFGCVCRSCCGFVRCGQAVVLLMQEPELLFDLLLSHFHSLAESASFVSPPPQWSAGHSRSAFLALLSPLRVPG